MERYEIQKDGQRLMRFSAFGKALEVAQNIAAMQGYSVQVVDRNTGKSTTVKAKN